MKCGPVTLHDILLKPIISTPTRTIELLVNVPSNAIIYTRQLHG